MVARVLQVPFSMVFFGDSFSSTPFFGVLIPLVVFLPENKIKIVFEPHTAATKSVFFDEHVLHFRKQIF